LVDRLLEESLRVVAECFRFGERGGFEMCAYARVGLFFGAYLVQAQ
jgi:hypothetical protein